MTFTEIVTEVTADLGLTSSEATTRVGRKVNIRYKEVVSSLGLDTSKRTNSTVHPTVGSAEITLSNYVKVTRVADISTGEVQVLDEVSWDELRETLADDSDSPTKWAVKRVNGKSVEIAFDVTFLTVDPDIRVDGYATSATLAGTDVPAFPEDFHDILVWGVKADELMKEEKVLLEKCQKQFDKRMSQLKLFLAKSLYMTNRRQSGRLAPLGRLPDPPGN